MINYTLVSIGVSMIIMVSLVLPNLSHSDIINPTHFDYSEINKFIMYAGFFGGLVLIFAAVFSGKTNKKSTN
jgi:H+/gluconate symporter-like permease